MYVSTKAIHTQAYLDAKISKDELYTEVLTIYNPRTVENFFLLTLHISTRNFYISCNLKQRNSNFKDKEIDVADGVGGGQREKTSVCPVGSFFVSEASHPP